MQLLLKTQTDFKDLEDDDPQVRPIKSNPSRPPHTHTQFSSQTPPLTLSALVGLQISYMISAWARMCKILGKDFQQYLPVVMGPLMKTASIKPEVALLDSESHPQDV